MLSVMLSFVTRCILSLSSNINVEEEIVRGDGEDRGG